MILVWCVALKAFFIVFTENCTLRGRKVWTFWVVFHIWQGLCWYRYFGYKVVWKEKGKNTFVTVPLKSFPLFCTCHYCDRCCSALHSHRPIACLHHSVPHLNWSILLKYDSERSVSVYYVNQHYVFVCDCERVQMSERVSPCVCVGLCVFYHAMSFELMSCFLVSFPVFFWTPSICSAALLCCPFGLIHLSFILFVCVLSLFVSLSLCWVFKQGIRALDVPV